GPARHVSLVLEYLEQVRTDGLVVLNHQHSERHGASLPPMPVAEDILKSASGWTPARLASGRLNRDRFQNQGMSRWGSLADERRRIVATERARPSRRAHGCRAGYGGDCAPRDSAAHA